LTFPHLPFANSIETPDDWRSLHVIRFNLIFINVNQFTKEMETDNIIGSIEYICPHKKTQYDPDGGYYYKFTRGGIHLKIYGERIITQQQYNCLQDELKHIH